MHIYSLYKEGLVCTKMVYDGVELSIAQEGETLSGSFTRCSTRCEARVYVGNVDMTKRVLGGMKSYVPATNSVLYPNFEELLEIMELVKTYARRGK